jgi:hypothetical protein
MGPASLYESFIDFGCNVMPTNSQIQLFNDEYWAYDHVHDGFYRSVGEVDFSTNINTGVPLTWTNWDYQGYLNGIVLKQYSIGGVQYLNQNVSYNQASISNLTTGTTTANTGFAITSNSWNLANETANMPNWSYKIAISNSPSGKIPTPVGIYNSNGTFFVVDPLP